MVEIEIIGIDIDGTLVDSSGRIGKKTKDGIEKISLQKDIKIAIVTSRSLDGILPIFTENGFKFPFFIIAEEREIYTIKNGLYVPLSQKWNGWIIKEEEKNLPLSKKFLKKWAKELQKKGLNFSFVSEEIERKRKYPSLIFPDINQAEIARRYAQKEISILNLPLRAERPAICLDIRSNQTGKGKTLNKAIEILGILSTQVLCIGDSHNDLEMLDGRYGFSSACPNNAEEMIKEAVRRNDGYVTKGNYGEGVLEILKYFLIGRE